MRCSLALLVTSVLACGHDPARTPDALLGFCSDQTPVAPTFVNVQRLFDQACVICHAPGVELDLEPGVSYADLVGRTAPSYAQPPTDESCGGVLVTPGDPAASYLYQKLAGTPCAGSQMPVGEIGAPAPLQPCALALIHDWIAAGAPP